MTPQTFTPSTSSIQRHALLFGRQKINLHQKGEEFEPKAKTALPGTAVLCFVIERRGVEDEVKGRSGEKMSLRNVIGGFERAEIEVLEGGKVMERTGWGTPKFLGIKIPSLETVATKLSLQD